MSFTRNETAVMLFLVASFIAGAGIWIYRHRWAPLPEPKEESSVQGGIFQTNHKAKEINDPDDDIDILRISLNKANSKELEQLPGVGPVIAARIIQYREQHGGFSSLQELIEVKGIGEKTVEKIKPYLKLH